MKRMLVGCLALTLVGCGGVAQKRRTFPVEVIGKLPSGANDDGWTVTSVTKATLRVEALRFFTGKVLISRRPRFEFISSAWAHPGHYMEGDALGELLTPVDVDLLAAAPVELGVANAVTGEYGSLQLSLGALEVEGVATKGAETVTFDSTVYTPTAPIEGVKFDKALQDEEGRVHLDVNLGTWLTRIDFSTAGAPGAGGVSAFPADSEAYNGFVRGVLDTSAYEVSWK